MKAATFLKVGGPEEIQYREVPDPTPAAHEVLIRTEAIGLNFADIYRRRGEYVSEPPAPFIAGYEGAGVIAALGEGVEDFEVGDRVGFAHVPRANAELVVAPAWKVIPLPDAIAFDQAAGILLQGLTAHYLTHDSYPLRRGDKVLVHAASGGVGLLLLQIARLLGAHAVGTVSSEAKREAALAAGAESVILRDGDWRKKLNGFDVVYDAIGTTVLDSIAAARAQGTVVYYGQAGGLPPAVDPNVLMAESKRLVGGELWSHIADRASLRERSAQLFTWMLEGKIRLPMVTRFPLARTAEAHAALESGRTQGKIVLLPN